MCDGFMSLSLSFLLGLFVGLGILGILFYFFDYRK